MEPTQTPQQVANQKGERKLRIKKAQRFAVKAHEHHQLKLKIFQDYCINKLGHSKRDWPKLKAIFEFFITKDNIWDYINTHSAQIYSGIFNNNLQQYITKSIQTKD